MAWTADEVSNLLESLLNEYNDAKYWAAAELTLYQKAAMSTILSKYTPWLYHQYGTWADFAITASTANYDQPDAAYKIRQIIEKEDGDVLRPIPREELWKYRDYSSGNPIGWCYKNNQVHLIPTPSTSDSDYLEIHYMPILDAVTEFPDCLRPLIAIEAAMLALQKDKYDSVGLINMKKIYEQNVYVEFSLWGHYHFPDFKEEDSLA